MSSDGRHTEFVVHAVNTGLVSARFGVDVHRCSRSVVVKTAGHTALISPQWSAYFTLTLVTDHSNDQELITCTGKATFHCIAPFKTVIHFVKKVMVSSYITQYPVLRIAQRTLHFTSLADLFNQTPSQLLWEASSHAVIKAGRLFIQISTTVYSHVLIHTAEWTVE